MIFERFTKYAFFKLTVPTTRQFFENVWSDLILPPHGGESLLQVLQDLILLFCLYSLRALGKTLLKILTCFVSL